MKKLGEFEMLAEATMMLILVALLSTCTPLFAQETQADVFSLSLEELMQIKITGSTLTPESLKTVPSAVTVFTYEEIRRMGLHSLDELMALVPGFQSYRTSNSSMEIPFSSRGRRIGNPSSEILVLVDGQRQEEPGTAGSAQVAPKFPLMQIERIEFIRGPGAAVYGSNAMMGVINIITRSGANELSAAYGSFNRRQIYFLNSHKMSDVQLDLFGHIEADDGDNFLVQDTFGDGLIETNDPRKLADLNIKIRWSDTQINFKHNQFKVENFYELNGISNDFNERSVQLSSVSLQQNFEWHAVDSNFWLSYSRTKFNITAQITAPGELTAISNPQSNDPLFGVGDFDNYQEFRTQWHNNWDINERSDLQGGIEYRHIDIPEIVARTNFDLGDLANGILPIRYYGALRANATTQAASTRDVVGVYIQYQRRLFEATLLTMGLRYDHFSSIASQLSPRVALVHEINNQHSIKLLYGEAFRAPAETELNLQNNPLLLGNLELKPESVQSWDLIWIGQWSDTTISLGYFENHFKNSILQSDIGGGTFQLRNEYQEPTKGIELELSYELLKTWFLRGTYTYINEKPDLSFREADQLASFLINYEQGQWNSNLIASYQGEREIAVGQQRFTLHDFWLVYAKVIYTFNRDWQAFGQVKNLLDEDYRTPTSGSTVTEGVPNRGREVLVGVTWHY